MSHANVHTTKLVAIQAELELYRCVYCDFETFYKLDRCEHYIRQHGNDGDCSQGNDEFERYACDLCGYEGHSSLSLIKHSCEETVPKDPSTDASYSANPMIDYDIKPNLIFIDSSGVCKEQPALMQVPHEQISWFNCTNCSYRTKWKGDLRGHIDARHGSNWLSCAECSFRTRGKKVLKQHMLVHETKILFNCVKCSYGTKRKGDLQSHMRTHATSSDEVDWFTCTKCTHRVRSKGHLKRHMLKHAASDQIKWFNCTKCSYRAESKDEIVRHVPSHAEGKNVAGTYTCTDELNWFICSECFYRAKRVSDVERHRRTVHAASSKDISLKTVRWFNCTKCSHRTKWKRLMKSHVLAKHAAPDEVDWVNCPECSYRGKFKANLRHHMKRHAEAKDVD